MRQAGHQRGSNPQPDFAWRLIGWVGVVFVLVGALDLLLLWIPAHFGNPEWEFASISAAMNGLPVPVMGMVMVTASGLARGHRVVARIGVGLLGLLMLAVIGSALIYALTIPLALRSAGDAVQRLGVQKSVAKTVGQVGVYTVSIAVMMWMSWRASAKHRTTEPS